MSTLVFAEMSNKLIGFVGGQARLNLTRNRVEGLPKILRINKLWVPNWSCLTTLARPDAPGASAVREAAFLEQVDAPASASEALKIMVDPGEAEAIA